MAGPHYSYRLPPELVDEIINLFHYTHFSYRDSLSNLCLVSKHWAHTCRRLRFQEVSITTRRSPEWSENSFNDFLRACPQVCAFIRDLSYHGSSMVRGESLSGDVSSSSLSETINQLPNLQRLHLAHIDFSLKPPAAQTQRHLQHLKIDEVLFMFPDECEVDPTVPTLPRLLQIFQSIDVLDIISCYEGHRTSWLQEEQGLAVRSLHTGCDSGYIAGCIDLKVLQTLCLRLPVKDESEEIMDDISLICKDCLNLQVLRLEFDPILRWTPVKNWLQDFDWEKSHIFSSPHLASITLRMTAWAHDYSSVSQPIVVVHNTLQPLLSAMRNMTQKVTLLIDLNLSSSLFLKILTIFDWSRIISNLRKMTNLEKLCFYIKVSRMGRDFNLSDYPELYGPLRRELLPLQVGSGPLVEIRVTYPRSRVPPGRSTSSTTKVT